MPALGDLGTHEGQDEIGDLIAKEKAGMGKRRGFRELTALLDYLVREGAGATGAVGHVEMDE